MGLYTTHDAWTGAYSAFNRWRDTLAEAADYTSHKNEQGLTTTELDWGNIEATIGRDLLGQWPAIPVRPDGTPDPLIILVAHSDCEGEIQAEFLAPLADRLEELLPMLEGKEDGGHIGNYVEKTKTFISGIRQAAADNEPLGFH